MSFQTKTAKHLPPHKDRTTQRLALKSKPPEISLSARPLPQSLPSEVEKLAKLKQQFDREIDVFANLREYAQGKNGLRGYLETMRSKYHGTAHNDNSSMPKHSSARVYNSSVATVRPGDTMMDQARRDSANNPGHAPPSSGLGGHKNLPPRNANPSGGDVHQSQGFVSNNVSQTPAMMAGQNFYTQTPLTGASMHPDGSGNSNFSLNFNTPFPSPGELAFCTGVGGGNNNWNAASDAVSSLPAVNIQPEDSVVETASRLLCHATVMDLFQIQKLVEDQLNAVCEFVCSTQPKAPGWDSGSLESATIMDNNQATAPTGNEGTQWQMGSLDPFSSTGTNQDGA
ncbi:hypothetical protein MKZ38_009534 [Zalerion maritima]|uniref:Uncharacterized protein n=1 Tax=Zalerion maritima TaxID=339359 RepID=A0AAD5RFX6_9PEZI|nr:hypothetical protein MKZ38_009534 [Zalerion maritima]